MTARERNEALVRDALTRLHHRNGESWWTAVSVWAEAGKPLTLGQTRYELGRLKDIERRRQQGPHWDAREYRIA